MSARRPGHHVAFKRHFSIMYLLLMHFPFASQGKTTEWAGGANRGAHAALQESPTESGVIHMPSTGERPGKGTYKCDNCGQIVVLDDDDDTLPPCPRCNETEYTKVG